MLDRHELTRQEEIYRDRLITAARTNDVSTIRDIISQLGERVTVVVNAADQTGDTALILAAALCHTDIIKALLAAGANINATDQLGNTALILAARRGHKAAAEVLLAAPDINLFAQNDDHFTAAEIAKACNHMKIYDLITAKAFPIKPGVEKYIIQNDAATLIQRCYRQHLFFKQRNNHCRYIAVWQPRPSLAQLAGMRNPHVFFRVIQDIITRSETRPRFSLILGDSFYDPRSFQVQSSSGIMQKGMYLFM